MPKMIVFDMDGVLCDAVGAFVRRHKLPADFEWPIGVWDVTEATGIPRAEFFGACSDHAFWAYEIKPLPHARTLFDAAAALVGLENIRVSTCPIDSPFSASGKLAWLKMHFPELHQDQVHVGCRKEELAAPGRVLLDDKPENVKLWRRRGGDAVMVPARWNPRNAESPLAAVKELQALFGSSMEVTADGGTVIRDGWGSELRLYGGGMRVTVVGCGGCPPVVGV